MLDPTIRVFVHVTIKVWGMRCTRTVQSRKFINKLVTSPGICSSLKKKKMLFFICASEKKMNILCSVFITVSLVLVDEVLQGLSLCVVI